MTRNYFQIWYEEVKKTLLGSQDVGNACIERYHWTKKPLVWFVQILSEKNGDDAKKYIAGSLTYLYMFFENLRLNKKMNPKWIFIATISFNMLFWKITRSRGKQSTWKMSLYCSSSSTTVTLGSFLRVTTDTVLKEWRIRLVCKTMKLLSGSLQKCVHKGSVEMTRKLADWSFEPFLVSYCCDMPDWEDISAE